MMREVVIAGAARTAIGSFGGSLAGLSAVELGIAAAQAALARAAISPDQVDEVIIGNVLSAAQGQNIARQVALGAGLPQGVPAMTLNKVCGSGLRSISLATQIIKAGDADIILAGGTESMSNAPYALKGHRFGVKMGHSQLIDTMISDGLWDAYYDYHMGVTAENVAQAQGISREEQDAFALQSQERAEAAITGGRFRAEIAPMTLPQRKGEPLCFDTDEAPRFGSTLAGLAKLRPAFLPAGTVTAGNASGLNDGAAMALVCSREKATRLGLVALATVRGYASAGVDPALMGMGVVPATQLALARAGLSIADIGLAEANEAFAAQALAVIRELGLRPEIVNVNGGAIALGHPIGASGARILTTLLYEMARRDCRYGLAALCIGGGMGTALVVERPR